jgi:hypothetical protein
MQFSDGEFRWLIEASGAIRAKHVKAGGSIIPLQP